MNTGKTTRPPATTPPRRAGSASRRTPTCWGGLLTGDPAEDRPRRWASLEPVRRPAGPYRRLVPPPAWVVAGGGDAADPTGAVAAAERAACRLHALVSPDRGVFVPLLVGRGGGGSTGYQPAGGPPAPDSSPAEAGADGRREVWTLLAGLDRELARRVDALAWATGVAAWLTCWAGRDEPARHAPPGALATGWRQVWPQAPIARPLTGLVVGLAPSAAPALGRTRPGTLLAGREDGWLTHAGHAPTAAGAGAAAGGVTWDAPAEPVRLLVAGPAWRAGSPAEYDGRAQPPEVHAPTRPELAERRAAELARSGAEAAEFDATARAADVLRRYGVRRRRDGD